jgi:hypothetical protein
LSRGPKRKFRSKGTNFKRGKLPRGNGSWLQKNPIEVSNLKRGRETRVIGRTPEGVEGQESFYRAYRVKLESDW